MFIKKLLPLSIIILVLTITIGAVSAEGNSTALSNDSPISEELEKTSTSTFKDFDNLINNADNNSEVKLSDDYAANSDEDGGWENRIIIEKTLTVDGNGHEIDGKEYARIDVHGQNTILKNMNFRKTNLYIYGFNSSFINCTFKDTRGVIESTADFNVIGCTFQECYANPIGAITFYGNEASIINCSFINYSPENRAIYSSGLLNLVNSSFINSAWYSEKPPYISNVSLDNSPYDIEVFKNLKGNEKIILTRDYPLLSPVSIDADNIIIDGGGNTISGWGSFFITGKNVTITNLNFNNTNTKSSGSAIYNNGTNVTIANCSFNNCNANRDGGAIYSNGNNSNVINSSFINCYSYDYGGGIYLKSSKCSIIGCNFINCSSHNGDAIFSLEEFELIDSSFINGTWYTEKPVYIYNVSIDNKLYDIDMFYNLKDNQKIILTKEYRLISPISIDVNNITIDGGQNYISGDTVFNINGDNVTIANLKFRNYEKAIYSNGNNLKIVNCTFLNNTNYHDGTIYSNGNNLKIENCTFLNITSYYDGTIYSKGNDLKIVNSTFSGLTGGAINSNGNNTEIFDCILTKCSSEYYSGGAIYSYGNNLKIVSCNFKECSASSGGAIFVVGNYSSIINSTFIKCSCEESGDAIYFTETFTLINSSFDSGAWYSKKSGHIFNVSVNNKLYDVSVFENLKDNEKIVLKKDYEIVSPVSIDANNIVIDGNGHSLKNGQIFLITGQNVTIKNCKFIDCGGNVNDGGVIYSSADNLKIVNCKFENCYGHSIYSRGANCHISECTFNDCHYYIPSNDYGFDTFGYYHGGAIYSTGDNCSIVNSNFANCYSSCGGAVYSQGNNCKIVNSDFVRCDAYIDRGPDRIIIGGYGGAIYCEGNNLKISASSFWNCEGNTGGAIFSKSHDCSIYDCEFDYCECNKYYYDENYGWGGAICICFNTTINGCHFNECSAYSGGAISGYYSGESDSYYSCNIINSHFKNCYDSQGKTIDSDYHKFNIVKCTGINVRIVASDLEMHYNDGSYFTVKVYGENAKIAKGVSVVFKLNGHKFKTVKTNKNGIAKVKITSPPQTYEISATALGVTVNKELTVKHMVKLKKVKVKRSAKKLTLQTTLAKKLKGKTITFKFNGKKYTAKTNKKGVAKVTIKKSVLKKLKIGKKLKYSATYLKDTVKKTVKIQK